MTSKSTITRWTNKVIENLEFDPELEDDLKTIIRHKLQRYHKIKKPSGRWSAERQAWLVLSPVDKATRVVKGLLDFQPGEDSKFKDAAELIRNTAGYYND